MAALIKAFMLVIKLNREKSLSVHDLSLVFMQHEGICASSGRKF